MGPGKEVRHPYPFPFDASEVVGREPDSVATRLGEQEKTTARGLDPEPVRWQGPGGRANPLLHRPFGFSMYSNLFLLFNTVFYLFLSTK